ncbi:DUF262 domain-containing protein [Paraburkholderia caribensis]|uniref:DUF262 domain-containing protein n=1 Tax=Paraburkholderia caribensis TaxID=75105 RepID=UPI001CAE4846|nr:DUF262 domain-containing protein [Paraburkholderia caribensis]CAG9269743.1 conserved hypothetical protein [Paraburkholderia caribensis]
MSSQKSINQFFAGKTFEIPKYQRSYAWEKQNVRDLFEDIKEALETNSNHYIGTVVLAKTDKSDVFNIVDGQQRITTIVMFISVIAGSIDDAGDRDFTRRSYVKQKDRFKLSPLERDRKFYFQILNGDITSEPESKSQRYMVDAYHEMKSIVENHIPDPYEFLKAIENLTILEFVEERESDAIRIFQTVNDRGRDLSRMDKMKSLLFYFSNKYLNQKHDDDINERFGEIFELYDDIKLTAEEQKINIISSRQFTEDDLLRHHHICFSDESYDPTGQQVLDNVKTRLLECRKAGDFEGMDAYISSYLNSLLDYILAFKEIVSKTASDADYYKLFSILGLSAVYYPVITQLQRNSFLDQNLTIKNISCLKMVEMIDVRVLKIREYAGKKHIAEFAYSLNNSAWTIDRVAAHLLWFNSHEISDDRFKDYLANYDYYKQTGLLRTLFIDYCERLRGKIYSLEELKKIMSGEPTIEHILSQTPKFKPRAYGFKDEEEFEEYKNILGNLTLLEKRLNSAMKNDDLVEKLDGYSASKFKMTTEFATALAATRSFRKADLVERGKKLVEDFARRWWA